MSELLPCPFCGSAARVASSEDMDGCYWAKVRCDGCGIESRGKWASSRENTCPIFYGEVRDEWNTRASLPTPGVPVERVRALAEKWRAEANGIDILDCSKAGLVNNCADELDALAQEGT